MGLMKHDHIKQLSLHIKSFVVNYRNVDNVDNQLVTFIGVHFRIVGN